MSKKLGNGPGVGKCPASATDKAGKCPAVARGGGELGVGPTFLYFPLFLGIFQWNEPTKRVPFTAEREIPEILTKWKAPLVSYHLQKC